MSIALRIEHAFRVRFDECGADGLLRDSGLLRYAQEMAWVHSEAAGFDRRWYRSRGLTWLVRSASIDVVAPVEHGGGLTVSTEVVGWRRVWARRASEFAAGGGDRVARATIDWVLLGPRGTPVRVPAEMAAFFTTADVGSFEPTRLQLPDVPPDAFRAQMKVRPRDLDPMAHVNNATYLDFAWEAIADAGGDAELGALPRRWELEFLRPAESGDELSAAAWLAGGGWVYRSFLPSGEESFRASVKTRS